MLKYRNYFFLGTIMLVVTLVYLNHFQNSFHFDDYHTIVENPFIKDLKYAGSYFTNVETFSTMPTNQGYRPVLTLIIALDHYFAKGLNPFYFQLSTFIFFLIQLLIMFFFYDHLLNENFKNQEKSKYYLVFIMVLIYGIHPANAETVNYIIAKGDSISTFFVILGLYIYAKFPKIRKFGIYLFPVILGMLTKQTAVVFVALLFLYILFFELKLGIGDLLKNNGKRMLYFTLKKTIPSMFICMLLGYFVFSMQKKEAVVGISSYEYLISQPWVYLRYFIAFVMPINLSADPGWLPLTSVRDERFIVGIIFIFTVVWLIVKLSNNSKTRPISFGLAWFFISLLPTSSFITLTQITNDHRMFFPFVGLVFAAGWSLYLLLQKWNLLENRYYSKIFIISLTLLIGINSFATIQRNKVWSSDESLWYDVVKKNPNHVRGLMNYGLSQMQKGNLDLALEYYERAYKIDPDYLYLNINMGILKDAMGFPQEAEFYFQKTLKYVQHTAPYYYYSRFLKSHERYDEAIQQSLNALTVNKLYLPARYLLMEIYTIKKDIDHLQKIVNETLKFFPNDQTAIYYKNIIDSGQIFDELEAALEMISKDPGVENYINLSLIYYNRKMYFESADACRKALKLDPKNSISYNNLCSALIMIGDYDGAIEAGKLALQYNPDFERAKNNLKFVEQLKSNQKRIENLEKQLKNNPTAEGYLNLSLLYYYNLKYEKSIDACYKALKIRPDYAEAYNNICSAYIKLEEYEKAIEACNHALKIKPDYELAKNNLLIAQQKLKN
ncbi:MAG TPA: tetratricopeptide repeat protein [Bacteroidales bacterium]|nr:tetratricopeptide repeat protein [Bacteroidales bacterium]HOL97102.1 tetratricopeptide repeat protein [Bacteroidales bacterium]HOM37389.1 tetratricopeptide repeat protein [Bacteroidales bacterium]HPD23113.1 tetratricopeptide repeat protein [Bacteroidales bacterium]HRT00685.1 tetratricopeptide repeat protein [Bacteroidales bacterium]